MVVETELIEDILYVAELGGDLDALIEDAHLPFPVAIPHVEVIIDSEATVEEQLESIIARSGDDVEAIKNDAGLSTFLETLIARM